MSCGVGCRRGSDLALQWLWYRPAAIAPIRPLGWEPSYAAGTALKRQKYKKKKKKKRYRIYQLVQKVPLYTFASSSLSNPSPDNC